MSEPVPEPGRRGGTRLIGTLLFGLAGGALLVLVLREVDIAAVLSNVAAVGIVGLGVVLAIYLAAFVCDSVSWLLTLARLPFTPGWMWRTFAVRMVGETFNNIVPAAGFGGEPVKAVLLKRHYGVAYVDTTASLVLARTVNMIALCAFLAIGFVLTLDSDKLAEIYKVAAAAGLAAVAVGTALFFLVQRIRLSSRAGGWLGARTGSARLAAGVDALARMDDALVRFYTAHGARLAGALALAMVNWLLGVAELYYLFDLLGRPITWGEAWIVEAVAQMVRSALFFLPLAVGAQEGVFLIVAGAISGVPALAVSVGLVRRVRELIWIVAGYAIGFVYAGRRGRAGDGG